MRKFLFCVCVILVLISVTLLIFQSGIEQALANQAASEVDATMAAASQESLNEPEDPEEPEETIQEAPQEADDEEAFDDSQFCHPPHTKDGVGGNGGFITDDP